jgi:hypothetical protein
MPVRRLAYISSLRIDVDRGIFESVFYYVKYWVWNGVHSASWGQLRSYLEGR